MTPDSLQAPTQNPVVGERLPTPRESATSKESSSTSSGRTSLEVCWSCCGFVNGGNDNVYALQQQLSEVSLKLEKVTEIKRQIELNLEKLQEKDGCLKQKLKELGVENSELKNKLLKQTLDNATLLKENTEYKTLVSQYNLEKAKQNYANKRITAFHEEVEKQLRDILSPYFTDNQINFFLTGEPVRKWSNDDIARTLTLKSISPNGYHYLREQLKLPFPSVSTLQRWTQGHWFNPGILDSVLQLMKIKGETMTKAERACILCFDEMKVTRAWEYRKIDDTILKPHNYVQVAILRGIIGNWKQVVFYDYDQKMTDHLLKAIITAVEQIGYEVHATVCDMGGSNYSLINQLKISEENNSFDNPVDPSRKINVFADVPHLVKLIRNHFLDHGFHSADGEETITCDSVRELIAVDQGKMRLAHKLTNQHVSVKGYKRQKVTFAVQLLSNTVSKALRFLGERGEIKSAGWLLTAKFIKLVNDWFDVMNSCLRFDPSGKRNAFHKTEAQMEVLSDMVMRIRSLRVNKRFLPFQKGILISSKSLVSLYDALHTRFGLTYILTRRLNQDVVESFFSVMRQMGRCYDHPTPLSFQHRLKMYIMGKDAKVLSANVNSLDMESNALGKENQKITADKPLIAGSDLIDDANVPCLVSKMFSGEVSQFLEPDEPKEDDNLNLSTNSVVHLAEEEATDYYFGYVVNKFRDKYPQLGHVLEETGNNKSWVSFVSKGKLKSMNPDYRAVLLHINKVFSDYHGEALQDGEGSSEVILKTAGLPPFFPTEVAKFFIRCKIYFMIKQLNNNLKEPKLTDYRQPLKKMKKIVN